MHEVSSAHVLGVLISVYEYFYLFRLRNVLEKNLLHEHWELFCFEYSVCAEQ